MRVAHPDSTQMFVGKLSKGRQCSALACFWPIRVPDHVGILLLDLEAQVFKRRSSPA